MFRITLALTAALALASCATVTRGTRTAFVVETVPSGAYVRLSMGQECTSTPCTFPQISREAEFTVTISKPGYRTVTANVRTQPRAPAAWVWRATSFSAV